MDYYLSFNNNEDRLQLPVIPSSFEITLPNQNTTVNINSIGEINLIGKAGLASISISSFFPNQEYSFCLYKGFPKPSEFIKYILKWKESGKPIRLIVTGTPINYAMAIESFTYGEQDGTGDVYFTLELKEYRFIKTSTVTQTTTKNGTTVSTPSTKRETKEVGGTYIVKAGDTLWTIAKKMTGNGENYKAIAKKNNIKDPNKISVGQKLVI
ncbi:LysM peptidoglycan-binding domain-containing protein [Zhenhengia yiwuensis]|uniref:LysM peptidoglycan-binding domain-containing protein n=1 Tax=Zhenhengia yiwuensis TaxID=2763666 RepID=A0A926EIP2_9FIRM|nr:LysM peptidoglycan-binding domain-containing protein [Zhenhengia yiwuensis]MBC8579132.1 LysM peptidoglycan-binding domain-containing protein [Zhenhengia yiwuensis]